MCFYQIIKHKYCLPYLYNGEVQNVGSYASSSPIALSSNPCVLSNRTKGRSKLAVYEDVGGPPRPLQSCEQRLLTDQFKQSEINKTHLFSRYLNK